MVENNQEYVQECVRVVECPARVCVPVQVTPSAVQGAVSVECSGPPAISRGTTTCSGVENGSCTLTLTQNIRVSIPIALGAESVMGAPHVRCLGTPVGNIEGGNVSGGGCGGDLETAPAERHLKDMLI